jgi:ABC-type nitrate/sulfonate/bicarbonate transport system substrate-binding protein
MGAEVAVKRGIGVVVLDARRDAAAGPAFHYTMPALVTTERIVNHEPDRAEAATRAIIATQKLLKKNVSRATEVGRKLFPVAEAELIADVVARDLPFYDCRIAADSFQKIASFAKDMGLADEIPAYDTIVPRQIRSIWA